MIQERKRHKRPKPVTLNPAHTLRCAVVGKTVEECVIPVGRTLVIDTIVTFDLQGEFGFEDGIGAIFGRAVSC